MFLFKFCPHSVPSSYLFTDGLSVFFCFCCQGILSFPPLGRFLQRSGSAGSFGCRRINVSVCSSIEKSALASVTIKRKHTSIKCFYAAPFVPFFFTTLVFSVSCRKLSSGTDVFSEAVLCGYHISVCLSVSLPCQGLSL